MNAPLRNTSKIFGIAVWLALGCLLMRAVAGAAWEEYVLLAPFFDMPCVPHGLEADDVGTYPFFLWYGIVLLFLMFEEGMLWLCGFWCRATSACKVVLLVPPLLLLVLLPCIILPCAGEVPEKDNGGWCVTFFGHALGALTLWLYIAGVAVCCLCMRRGLLKEEEVPGTGRSACSLFRLAWQAFQLTVGVPCMLLLLFVAVTLLACWCMLEGGLAAAALLHTPEVLPSAYEWGYLLGSTLGSAAVVALLYSWRRCGGRRWLRVLLSIPVAMLSLASAAVALASLLNALRVALASVDAGNLTPLWFLATTLHFLLLCLAGGLWLRRAVNAA